MPIYPYSFQLPPLNVQDIPNDGVAGEFLGINVGGALDWLPAGGGGSGDMLAANNLSELTNFATARTNIGLGTASTPTFANLTLTSPSLASSAPVTISQTWATTGTYTAAKVNVTETATANPLSNLLDLQLAGNSLIAFKKSGQIHLTGTEYAIGTQASHIIFGRSVSALASLGTAYGTDDGGFKVAASGFFGISFVASAINNADVKLYRDGAGTFGVGQLALRNGGNPQTFNVYGTYSSASVYERMFMRYTAASTLAFQIGTEQVGATARPLQFSISGSKRLIFEATGVNDTQIYAAGNTARNILTLRGLDESGRYQFYINAAGKSELYVGTGALISEAGSSYFNGGNVGIGTTAPGAKLHVAGNGLFGENTGVVTATPVNVSFGGTVGSFAPGNKGNLKWDLYNDGTTALRYGIGMSANLMEFQTGSLGGFGFYPGNTTTSALHIITGGNVGIGTTSPTSKLHVAGSSSPSITVDNTLATGASQLLFKNTVVTGDTDGIFLNGSTQTGFGGAGSLNIKATTGPIAFHTASVTNALSIAQNGAATFSSTVVASSFYPAGIQGLSHNGLAVTLGVNTWKLQVEGTLLCFSGVTASFPAFKRVGAEFQVVNAGTTAALNVAAPEADLTFIEDRYRRKGAGTPEGVVTAPIGAVYHNTTGGAGTSFYVKESGTGNTGWVGK